MHEHMINILCSSKLANKLEAYLKTFLFFFFREAEGAREIDVLPWRLWRRPWPVGRNPRRRPRCRPLCPAQCSRCRPSTLRCRRWLQCARRWRRAATSKGSQDSCGRCRSRIQTSPSSTRTKPCCGRERLFPSTAATTAKCIQYWSTTNSAKTRTASCRPCGLKRITRRRKNCGAGRSVPWTNIECEKSSHFLGLFGMVNKRRIVLRKEHGRCFVSGTCRTPIRTRQKSANWRKRLDLPLRKSATGSRTEDSVIERQPLKTGKIMHEQ